MAGLIKNLLGGGANNEQLSEELRAILDEIKREREGFEESLKKSEGILDRIQQLSAPIDDAETQLQELDGNIKQLRKVTPELQWIKDQSEALGKAQKSIEERMSTTGEKIDTSMRSLTEVSDKLDTAIRLKDDLNSFLAMEGPFKALRSDAEELTNQLRNYGEEFNRLRSEQDESMNAQREATGRLDSAQSRFQSVCDRIENAEQQLSKLKDAMSDASEVDRLAQDTRRQVNTLKKLSEFVTQKVTSLEEQRETIDHFASRSENLAQAMSRVDERVREQEQNSEKLAELLADVEHLKSLHAEVIDWSEQIAARQQELAKDEKKTQESIDSMRREIASTVRRFEVEKNGMDSVSKRVVDVRANLNDFETRLNSLDETSETLNGVRSMAEALSGQVNAVSEHIHRVEEQAKDLQSVRKEVERLDHMTQEVWQRVDRIEEIQPAVKSALDDFAALGRTHASVKDTLERVRITQDEIKQIHDKHLDTQDWLHRVHDSVGELREKVTDLNALRGDVESTRREADKVVASIAAIESRREFAEEMHTRLADLASLGSQLDERSKGLLSRLDTADKRFISLSEHSKEAKRVEKIISAVVSSVEQSEAQVAQIVEKVGGLEGRASDLNKLAERSRQLGTELEQRQNALDEAMKQLEHASELRKDAADLAQKLSAQNHQLVDELNTAEQRAKNLGDKMERLEDRAGRLKQAEKGMSQFEVQVSKWEMAELQLRRTLEKVLSRQATIDALKGDIKHMFEIAERTVTDVRAIEAAHHQVTQSRDTLDHVLEQIKQVDAKAGVVEDRKRQIEAAEKRLSGAEALLGDLQSTLEALQAQKTFADEALETTGALSFQTKQARALVDALREERELTDRVMAAVGTMRSQKPSNSRQAAVLAMDTPMDSAAHTPIRDTHQDEEDSHEADTVLVLPDGTVEGEDDE